MKLYEIITYTIIFILVVIVPCIHAWKHRFDIDNFKKIPK